MKKLFALGAIIGLSLSVAACAPESHNGANHESSASHSAKGIVISGSKVVPPFPGRDVSAGYFELINNGADDRLLSISSPLSPRVEMHTHLNEDGVMKMRKVDGVALPRGETVVFKPGSYHIMMFGVTLPDDQKDAALTFNFETAPSVTIIAEIDGRGGNEHDGH